MKLEQEISKMEKERAELRARLAPTLTKMEEREAEIILAGAVIGQLPTTAGEPDPQDYCTTCNEERTACRCGQPEHTDNGDSSPSWRVG